MTLNLTLFGPPSEAYVTISGGKATQIRIEHPNGRQLIIPGDWASNIVGSDSAILSEVSRNLMGLKAHKV